MAFTDAFPINTISYCSITLWLAVVISAELISRGPRVNLSWILLDLVKAEVANRQLGLMILSSPITFHFVCLAKSLAYH